MYRYNCDIVRVVDGDTIDVLIDLGFDISLRERVRLYEVDTPEVFGPNASEEGREASEFVKKWLSVREYTHSFILESMKYNPRDKYGRCLGEIIAVSEMGSEPESLNEVLKLKGWAYKK